MAKRWFEGEGGKSPTATGDDERAEVVIHDRHSCTLQVKPLCYFLDPQPDRAKYLT